MTCLPRYGLRCTVQPTHEPVTVAAFKASQRITSDDEDATIADLISAARAHIELLTRRRFVTSTWELTLDEFPNWELIVPVAPLATITSLAYVDEAGANQTVSSGDYILDIKREPGRLTPTWGNIWPVTRVQANAVTLTFTAGYGLASSVPALAKRAITLLAAHWYENKEPYIVGTNVAPLPMGIDALVQILHVGTYP